MSHFVIKENKFWRKFLFHNKKRAGSIKSHIQQSKKDDNQRLGPVKSKSTFTLKNTVSKPMDQSSSLDMEVNTPTSTTSTTEMHDFIMINKQDDIHTSNDEKEENKLQKEPKEEREVEEKVENSANQNLLEALQTELDRERATMVALQKQKQAITKDLDYLSLTIDELQDEKNEILEQLEQEKIKNQNQLEDLNLLLEKIKTAADDAREKAFAVDQAKLELKNFQEETRMEKEQFLNEIESKNKLIRSLKAELSKSQEQTTTLQSTIDNLEKTHAEEINKLLHEKQSNTMHTPQSSLRITNNSATSSSTFNSRIATHRLKRKETNLETVNLDDQLLKLTKEKEKLQSHYSKIPLTGGGPQSRKRREELEYMLDQVDSQLSKVKQKIKRS